MSFDDNDLKRLKDNMEAHGDHYRPGTFVIRPLLARLEAAELLIEPCNRQEHFRRAEAWRKLAGK